MKFFGNHNKDYTQSCHSLYELISCTLQARLPARFRYHSPAPTVDIPESIGILLVNLGTPDAPSEGAVRRYLAEFLSDPRVVEMPRLLWRLILHGVILRTHPRRSAAAYRKIWTDEGSPLLAISRQQSDLLQQALEERMDGPVRVELAMRYGSPSIPSALERLRRANARRVIVLPLYPQYSATTTGSTFDAVTGTLHRWRWLPELRFINHYHDDPGYIGALANSVCSFRERHGEPDHLLISFHGIPQAYADGGDPYPEECRMTARLLAEALELEPDRWSCSFQSRMGRKPWVRPYTDETLKAMGNDGVAHLHVLCPGFPADCLETLEEIGEENRARFLEAGGKEYRYIPALNTSPGHIEALADLILRHTWSR